MIKPKDIYVCFKKKYLSTKAIKTTRKSFVTKDEYDDYKNDTQKEIKDTGRIIENIYIKNKITIKRSNIPVDQKYIWRWRWIK